MGGGVKPMIATRSGTLAVLPSGSCTAIGLVSMVHGLKMGAPSRVLSTFASTSGKCGPAHCRRSPPSTFIGVPVTCESQPSP